MRTRSLIFKMLDLKSSERFSKKKNHGRSLFPIMVRVNGVTEERRKKVSEEKDHFFLQNWVLFG